MGEVMTQILKRRMSSVNRAIAYAAAACTIAQPVFAAPTDLSPVPLASTFGANLLPNVLFTLDDSGSMAWDYLPDYVNDANKCMNKSDGTTACLFGDPPYSAGGPQGFNGVGYDPNIFYAPGLKSDGKTTVKTAPLPLANVPDDAYDLTSPTDSDITSEIPDTKYCNSAGTCKRSGADNGGTLVSGTDASGNSMATGQFPYRTHALNSSTRIFGLPETMSIGSFTRSGTTVTVTSVEPHGLTTSDKVYVPTTTSSLNVTCVAVTGTPSPSSTTFTYTSGTTGTFTTPVNGNFRKCVGANFTRNSGTVTVDSTAHGLATGDVVTTFIATSNAMNATSVTITFTNADRFTYTVGSGSTAVTAGSWVRSGLYNVPTSVSGTALAYRITPVEYCSDVNLTTCTLATTPGTAPAGFPNPAYVRFCKTQADALTPSLVTGTSGSPATARCQSKFVNSLGFTYINARYGLFTRENITSAGSYTNRPDRVDCTSKPTCSGAEEQQNYARWWAYYRTRIQMTKTVAGRSFVGFIGNTSSTPPKPNRLRVGLITIHAADSGSVSTSKYLKIANFDTAQASSFYTTLYAQVPSGGTPLQEALSRAGWIFAGKLGTGLTNGIPAADDPMQSSCQRNFSILQTDGYWNGANGQTISGGAIANRDNFNPLIVPPYTSPMVDRPTTGTYDGAPNIIVTKKVTTTETQSICGQGLADSCGCTKNNNKRIRDILTTDTETITVTDGVQTSDITVLNSLPPQSSTIGSCSSGTPTITLSPNPKVTTTTTTTPAGGATAETLADVAMYYYMTDLRGGKDADGNLTGPATSPNSTPTPNADVSANNVPARAGDKDFATHQHMVTFTLGMADGLMRYQAGYDTATTGDFANIKNAAVGACYWSSGVCNWPTPAKDDPAALDDLWHAAVNGRGQYFQGLNATALSQGLQAALNALNVQVASAAAAATSSPQLTSSLDKAFSTTYQTGTWSGRVYAQNLDPVTAEVKPAILWEAHLKLLSRITAIVPTPIPPLPPYTDTRKIVMFDSTNLTTKTRDFAWLNLSAAEKDFLQNKCSPPSPATPMSQCGTLVGSQPTAANDGTNMLRFLRGHPDMEAAGVYRDRNELDPATNAPVPTMLGDVVNAQPVFVGPPFFEYDQTDATYGPFKNASAQQNRHSLYTAGNDGYLHSFNTDNGDEYWSYLPKFVMPALYQLADFGYGAAHRFYLDGTPEMADVFDGTNWRTILVGGANAGARGFYAIDVTDPLTPKGLWEFCSDSTLCAINDNDLGFSFGNPVIGKRKLDGKWVVVLSSGLNNTSPGTGQGYLYVLDVLTGKILNKAGTGVGDTTNPSGLMKMGAYYPDGLRDATFTHIYAGDQLGHLWRLDMGLNLPAYPAVILPSTATKEMLLLATLKDAQGRIQPITARPAGTPMPTHDKRVYYVGTGRYLGDGTHGGMSDLSDPGLASGFAWDQSIYAIIDRLDTDANGYGDIRQTQGAKLVKQTLSPLSPSVRKITKNPVDWTKDVGFVIDLNPPTDPTPGERVVLDVRLVFGTLVITSTIPVLGGCTGGGTSFQYNLDYKTGGYVGNSTTGAAGWNLGQLVVGTAVTQTSEGTIKALNKSFSGENTPISIQISDVPTTLRRFSYRER